ncbi:helix-turn-helix domain-containing protein [Actinoalloteichus spitiensis]|uniref:helix-turn-helix domain-containing protein n=1 Tax=Actinoalloteichus spitiensis TaxID=252394 RepID=UPI000308BF7B|nr:helix-turn-helix domain-containing protein [Actinoalloteichus spitiensis]
MSAARAAYSVSEVARLLGIGRSLAYHQVRTGVIPARQLGDRWVISKARFHKWLDEEEAM